MKSPFESVKLPAATSAPTLSALFGVKVNTEGDYKLKFTPFLDDKGKPVEVPSEEEEEEVTEEEAVEAAEEPKPATKRRTTKSSKTKESPNTESTTKAKTE